MNYREIIDSRFSEPAAIILHKDDSVKILELNERFIPELWMNVSKEDYISAYPQECFDGRNLQIYLDAIKKCIATGEDQTAETWRIVFSNCCGQDKVCMKSRFVLVEKTDEGAVIYEGISNVSNEKRTQETLDDIEYRYKNASEQINIYNWEYIIATKDMRPCYRCMRDLGLPAVVHNYPEPPIDMGIFPPDYADKYRDFMRRIDAGEDGLEIDIPLTVGRIPFRIKYTIERDDNDTPIKAFGSATLISDAELGRIKLDNQIIARLAEEYSCIYLADFSENKVSIVKQDGTFTLQDDATCNDLAVLLASRLEDIQEDLKQKLYDADSICRELFKDIDNREFVYKDDLKERWIRIEYHVIERTEVQIGRMLITVSVIDDYRAQKMNADRLIASQKEELEDRQKRLIDAIEVANKANKAKTEFFSNMSHDIRTPMSAITGFSRLAMDEIEDKEQVRDYLEKISSAGDHLMNLINDILDMSRIESGKMELSAEPVTIKELLTDCADIMRVKMDDNGLLFLVDLDDIGDDVVLCDKLRFNQVILNLLSNAYKYTKDGGCVFLEGSILEKKDEDLVYEIRVRDTGIGMSEEFCQHIWDAFSREDTGEVRETQGTGLGMGIVKKFITMMRGTIEVSSKQGEGTEFIIILPFKIAGENVGDEAQEEDIEDVLNKNYEGYTLLVVDDSAINLMVAEKTLARYGFTVIKSESGVEALQKLTDGEFTDVDLILMDVMMPVMDGLETTRKIRAIPDPKISEIPIIAMTANAFDSDVKVAYAAGMNDYIAKPYRPEDILPLINKHLK